VPIPAVATGAKAPGKVALSTDCLFRFDGVAESDLLPEGERKIVALAGEIKRNFRTLEGILVTGHIDLIGSDDYNDRLSKARANTVRMLLVRGHRPSSHPHGRSREAPAGQDGLHRKPIQQRIRAMHATESASRDRGFRRAMNGA
jgi:outer membrane protein OmpA-like peptidoglycan-associated protein